MKIVGGRKGNVGKSGIYAIKNLVNGKVYIGQAVNMYLRYKAHLNALRYNRSRENQHLRNAWNKYGENNFICIPLMYCARDKELLTYFENFWCTTYANLGFERYNNRPSADSNAGVKHSPEHNERKGAIAKELWKTPEYRERVISGVMAYWDEDARKERSEKYKGRKMSPESIARSIEKRQKSYVVIHPDGTVENITGLSAFCREHNLDPSEMVKTAKGKANHHKGFKCKYLNN